MDDNQDHLHCVRHSFAHVMAEAVLKVFPDAKLAIGPVIDNGFYYDLDITETISPEDLAKVEEAMKGVLAHPAPFERKVVSRDEALSRFQGDPYKVEMINELPEGSEITTFTQNGFTDLCRGPHVATTAELKPDCFKLLSVAGAYWRGDEKNRQLQRIYGTAWETPEQLADYLFKLAEAERRDHRKVGRELDLFSADSDLIGGGLVLWHQKGALVRHLIESFWKEQHLQNDYDLVNTPHIGRGTLWETSGHLSFYKDSMYAPLDIDGQEYFLKPMNCPFHILIYKSARRSYRELPMRMAEMGTVYRYERSGVLHGLLRVRGFTQDDAHHFVQPEKMPQEIDFVLDFSLKMLRAFGFSDFSAYLATRPAGDKAVGDPADWTSAQNALEDSLKRANLPYSIDEGGGAFYGPKIDIKIKDALQREWQLSTIQFDFNLPERFNVTYIGEDGQAHRPYMVHRALLGSLERFFGILVEHYAGAFPVWLAPVQVLALSIADRHMPYCEEVVSTLKGCGIRAKVDLTSERLGKKISTAQLQKVPYMLVVGDKEMASKAVSVRTRGGKDLGATALQQFVDLICEENKNRVCA